jgi:hypothetical protein
MTILVRMGLVRCIQHLRYMPQMTLTQTYYGWWQWHGNTCPLPSITIRGSTITTDNIPSRIHSKVDMSGKSFGLTITSIEYKYLVHC